MGLTSIFKEVFKPMVGSILPSAINGIKEVISRKDPDFLPEVSDKIDTIQSVIRGQNDSIAEEVGDGKGGNIILELIDDLFDKIEQRIEDSETELDDKFILPMITAIRDMLDIPDDIGGDED